MLRLILARRPALLRGYDSLCHHPWSHLGCHSPLSTMSRLLLCINCGLCRSWNSAGLMAFKAFELGRMGILDCVLFTGAVTFHACRDVVDRDIFMNCVGRNAWITFSRYGKKQSYSQKHKNNKSNCTFHS